MEPNQEGRYTESHLPNNKRVQVFDWIAILTQVRCHHNVIICVQVGIEKALYHELWNRLVILDFLLYMVARLELNHTL